jgi:hypothetical protein
VYIFRELWHVLTTQRLVAPGYTVLQELIGKALTEEQQRLSTVIRTQMAPLYTLAQRVLPALEISNESIAYYASLVHYYSNLDFWLFLPKTRFQKSNRINRLRFDQNLVFAPFHYLAKVLTLKH